MYCLEGSGTYSKMSRLCENDTVDADSDAEDPEQLLNEWLGELSTLTGGLDPSNTPQLRPLNPDIIAAPRIDSYRFSMANLQDSQDVDLDAILGELNALESQCDREIGAARDSKRLSDQKAGHISRSHSRNSSETTSRLDDSLTKTMPESTRTDSPDNDSAFSDTVSMLSSESSASSGGSAPKMAPPQSLHLHQELQDEAARVKAEKIRMAMEKIKEANIQKLFVKVFTNDGSAKSLLVDEKMVCSYVTRLLMDKNHVEVDPKWAIVEHLPELYMERVYEDHELLVDNLMLWTRDSKNKIFFAERPEKNRLFLQPERFLLIPGDKREHMDHDEHTRNLLLEEFFSSTSRGIPELEGPLYLKSDSKKGWKKYHFVLRASGLYYYPKEKVKSAKDLVCLATFDNNHIYHGLGWKKKFKAPTDFCFAIKHPRLQEPKSTKFIKYLCAEDPQTMEKWMVGMRVAKHGRQLMDNYRAFMDEMAQEDLDILAHARSCSVSSITVSNVTTPTQSGYQGSEAGYGTQSETSYSTPSEASSGRHSRASSSSSSGCMSDGAPSSCENAFDSEFPTGTIKRKPSMKPSLPLTNITRQLKEVGETRDEIDAAAPLPTSPLCVTASGTLTRRHSRRKSANSDDSSGSGTLKRQHSYKTARGSLESVGGRSGGSTPLCGTPVRERASPFADRLQMNGGVRSPPPLIGGARSSVEIPSCMTDSITSLPPPPEPCTSPLPDSPSYTLPPPPPEVYNSTMSLDSLPPPPNPHDLPPMTGADLTGSQLSLMSLPPPPTPPTACATPTDERTPTTSPTLSNCSTPTQSNPPNSFAGGGSLRSSLRQISCSSMSSSNSSGTLHSPHLQRKGVNFQQELASPKKSKKISFNLVPQEVPPLPKKPPPPKRAESTKLSSPKKLVEPPVDFLKDLQRVMRKKWQVAQKCKLEPATTPHEVLGFRDPPVLLPDYKEHNVSNWVQEHYGPNNLYENIYRSEGVESAAVEYACSPYRKRPPPPPPKRSETTHLTSKQRCSD